MSDGVVVSRVVPETDLAGYPAITSAGYPANETGNPAGYKKSPDIRYNPSCKHLFFLPPERKLTARLLRDRKTPTASCLLSIWYFYVTLA